MTLSLLGSGDTELWGSAKKQRSLVSFFSGLSVSFVSKSLEQSCVKLDPGVSARLTGHLLGIERVSKIVMCIGTCGTEIF